MAMILDPAFRPAFDVFQSHFEESANFREIGSSLAVFADGECVLKDWGGVANPETGAPWQEDTLTHVFSTTKGLLVILLAQLGGDWSLVTGRLAAQAPFWEPGTKTSYHAMSFGYIGGEIARRITGKMPNELLQERLAGPLDLDVQFGVRHADWHRVSVLTPPPPPPGGMPERDPLALKPITNPHVTPALTSEPGWRMAQIPAVNGHVTALSMAKLWGAVANGGKIDGQTT